MTSLSIHCTSPVQAHDALTRQMWPWIKAQLLAGQEMTLEAKPANRSDAENRLLHAMLGHISKTQEWAGKRRDIETWKRLLVAAWCRAIGEQIELLPSLDGHGVDIVFRRTSQLSRKECADLIEFIFSWGASHNIAFPPVPRRIDQTTGEILEAA